MDMWGGISVGQPACYTVLMTILTARVKTNAVWEAASKLMSRCQPEKGSHFFLTGTSSMKWFVDTVVDGSYEKMNKVSGV